LGVLVGALRRARSLGGDISLVVTKPTIKKVLTMTGLDRTFDVGQSLAEVSSTPTTN
jgi:anti-anti-sigma factor